MKKIKLPKGKLALVDDSDYPFLNRLKWEVIYKGRNWYAVIRKIIDGSSGRKQTSFYMHEFLINLENRDCVTFRNGNTLDYRKDNLFGVSKGVSTARSKKRLTTHGGKKPTSRFKGVCRRLKKKGKKTWITWEVRIAKGKKVFYCGSYKTQKEAAMAYNDKAKELYGDFAYQNQF